MNVDMKESSPALATSHYKIATAAILVVMATVHSLSKKLVRRIYANWQRVKRAGRINIFFQIERGSVAVIQRCYKGRSSL